MGRKGRDISIGEAKRRVKAFSKGDHHSIRVEITEDSLGNVEYQHYVYCHGDPYVTASTWIKAIDKLVEIKNSRESAA
jgi:hypothetical protein